MSKDSIKNRKKFLILPETKIEDLKTMRLDRLDQKKLALRGVERKNGMRNQKKFNENMKNEEQMVDIYENNDIINTIEGIRYNMDKKEILKRLVR